MDDNYSWVKFYEKLAIGLGAFEKDRDTLLKWIYASLSEFTNYLHQPNHSKLSDIDPFTVIGTFNRHISVENKKRIAQEFKSFLQLDVFRFQGWKNLPRYPKPLGYFHRSHSQPRQGRTAFQCDDKTPIRH